LIFFLYACHEPLVSYETASSSAQCSRDKPPLSFVKGQDSTMWDIVWVSPQGHRSVSVSRHFLLQAPQCPCSMRKRFSRERPLLPRDVKIRLLDCVTHYVRVDHLSRLPAPSTIWWQQMMEGMTCRANLFKEFII